MRGRNDFGQLGDGTTTLRLAPVNVSGGLVVNVSSISAGLNHTCALTTAGAVRCWRSNSNGQLGNNSTTTQRPTPTNVTGLCSGMATVSAGGNFTCALTTTGGLKCWGVNDNGQLGDNSLINRSVPVDIRRSQSISFSTPATASSTMAVAYDVWTPTNCTHSGNLLNLIGAPGTLCGVRASQSGASTLPAGGSVVPAPQQLRVIQIPVPLPVLDIDSSAPTTPYDAASDGAMLIRYLLGYRGSALTLGAVSPVAGRNATQNALHITTNLTLFDVDGDGVTLATTDGVMILRRLLGFTNAVTVTQGVKNSNRSDADVVLAIDALKP